MIRSVAPAAAWFALALTAARSQEAVNPFRPFDRAAFESAARVLGASDEDIATFRSQCDAESEALASETLLRRVVTKYDLAVALAERGDPRAALELAALVSSNGNRVVTAHARYHLGRVFLDGNDPEKAAETFAELLRQDRNLTALDAEAAFFYASALADIPVPGSAARAFGDYLSLFPSAPERFRAVAAQRRAELEDQFQNPLHEIADDMKRVGREIDKTRTGTPTQETQASIVTRLEQIIEELEERERQSSGSPSGSSQSNSPASNSAAPEGASRIGELHNVPGVKDRWDVYKDQDRKAIETDVQTRLPSHYRKLLEDYYDKLGRGPSRSGR